MKKKSYENILKKIQHLSHKIREGNKATPFYIYIYIYPFSQSFPPYFTTIMLMFSLENVDPLLDALYILSRCAENTIIQCSPSMVSIIVLHHELDLNVSFQMMPQFFSHFASNKTHSSKTLIQPLYNTLKRMKESQITSFSFFLLPPLDHLVLKFYSPS